MTKKKNSDRILMIQITISVKQILRYFFFIKTSIIPVQTIEIFNIPLRFEGVE